MLPLMTFMLINWLILSWKYVLEMLPYITWLWIYNLQLFSFLNEFWICVLQQLWCRNQLYKLCMLNCMFVLLLPFSNLGFQKLYYTLLFLSEVLRKYITFNFQNLLHCWVVSNYIQSSLVGKWYFGFSSLHVHYVWRNSLIIHHTFIPTHSGIAILHFTIWNKFPMVKCWIPFIDEWFLASFSLLCVLLFSFTSG